MRTPTDIHTLADAVGALRRAHSRREVNAIEAAFHARTEDETERAIAADVACLALDRLRAADEARRDALTGVLNRRGFAERCRESVVAFPGPVAVGAFDVDGLKAINDRHGHAAGSAVLRGAADALQAAFGADAVIGRLGGDEFAVLVPDRSDLSVLRARLDATVRGRAAMPDVVRLEVSAGFAAGIATTTEDVDALLAEADADLYERRRVRRDAAGFRFTRAPLRLATRRGERVA